MIHAFFPGSANTVKVKSCRLLKLFFVLILCASNPSDQSQTRITLVSVVIFSISFVVEVSVFRTFSCRFWMNVQR